MDRQGFAVAGASMHGGEYEGWRSSVACEGRDPQPIVFDVEARASKYSNTLGQGAQRDPVDPLEEFGG
ncbi:MAG: hypothetical protein L3K08_05175 [Thermoplasmata archaeon]|nr:hypothetical protein [Thermoplasmata archaeon]